MTGSVNTYSQPNVPQLPTTTNTAFRDFNFSVANGGYSRDLTTGSSATTAFPNRSSVGNDTLSSSKVTLDKTGYNASNFQQQGTNINDPASQIASRTTEYQFQNMSFKGGDSSTTEGNGRTLAVNDGLVNLQVAQGSQNTVGKFALADGTRGASQADTTYLSLQQGHAQFAQSSFSGSQSSIAPNGYLSQFFQNSVANNGNPEGFSLAQFANVDTRSHNMIGHG